MDVRTLRDHVAIRRDVAEEVSEGGIHLGEKDKETPDVGTVVSVGTGKVLEDGSIQPMSVSVNDRVIFAKDAGTEIKIGKEILFVVRETDIVGILT